MLSSIWSTIWGFISETLTNIWNGITSTFTNILNSITETVGNIKNSIVEGFQAAIDWITSLPEQALQWGADIIQGIVDGITGAVDKVGEAVKGVADKIKSFLGFSEPEDGPLSDFHTYMPDMLQLMAEGIQKGKSVVSNAIKDLTGGMSDEVQDVDPNDGAPEPKKPKGGGSPKPTPPPPGNGGVPTGPMPQTPQAPVAAGAGGLDAVKGVVGAATKGIQTLVGAVKDGAGFSEGLKDAMHFIGNGMNALMGAATPRPSTVSTVTGSNNVSRSVVQNIEINNKYEGDRAGQQKSSQAAKEAGRDITTELARGLSYAR